MSAIRKAFFFPTIFYNVVMDTVRSRNWFNRIDKHVVLGAMPFRSGLESLVSSENIKGIISMNEEFELNPRWYATKEELKKIGVEFLNLPVDDYVGLPTSEQIASGLHFIEHIIQDRQGSVYIHCKAGRSRSAYLAAAYLIAREEKKVEEVVAQLKSKRPQVWIGAREVRSLEDYYTKAIGKGKS
ncbi:putative Phosphatidylglycerophosphatase and protein-tyrosine phosphatase 1 [Hypsibius exemplaris]|uniref:Phosphatidylglycerophosphatase and protein-tyrosine phosphatase 1 n=1 Tax=Hypsibius exemplaris TaxID=2072580 RepID=A0A1W0X979_HYPEX|nr:putative Phosphatidylglycerophosphatase and protein-tyrosine phosphatase 1 [Hypsibius exemplaris]